MKRSAPAISAAILAAAVAVAAPAASAPAGVTAPAGAAVTGAVPAGAGGKALVVLGDSYSAHDYDLGGDPTSCLHGPADWPAQLGRLMSLAPSDVADESCEGAAIDTGPGYTVTHEALEAAGIGAFGPRTRAVTLQFGLNDSWPRHGGPTIWNSVTSCVFDLRYGCSADAANGHILADFHAISGELYAARIRQAVDYIRYYAPHAHIVLVGYPTLISPSQDAVCLSFLGVGRYIQPRGRAVVEYFNRLNDAERQAAALLGIEFFDSTVPTAGHGACTAQSWINGAWEQHGLPFHPTPTGDAAVAAALYRTVMR